MVSEQQLVKFFVEKIKEKGVKRIALKLKIDEIDSIKVKTEIVCQSASMRFDIETTDIKKHSQTVNFPSGLLFSKYIDRPKVDGTLDSSPLTEEEVKKAMKELTKILKNLKFNKMENKILSEAPKNKLFDSKFVQECSVCLEPTKGKTPCQHFLCYPCWQGIQQRFCECRNESDEEIFCDRPCPVCRAPIENTELPF